VSQKVGTLPWKKRKKIRSKSGESGVKEWGSLFRKAYMSRVGSRSVGGGRCVTEVEGGLGKREGRSFREFFSQICEGVTAFPLTVTINLDLG